MSLHCTKGHTEEEQHQLCGPCVHEQLRLTMIEESNLATELAASREAEEGARTRWRIDLARAQAATIIANNTAEKAEAEVARLRERYSALVTYFDDLHGTPCEQIRHAEEVADLKRQLDAATKEAMAANQRVNDGVAERERLVKAASEAVNEYFSHGGSDTHRECPSCQCYLERDMDELRKTLGGDRR